MEPKTKKIVKKTEMAVTTKVEKTPALTSTTSVEKAPRKVIPAKVAKTSRVVKTVKTAAKTVKNDKAVTPKEPTRKVSPPKVVKPAKVVKLAKAASVPELAETAKPDLSKPRRLSSGQRTFIRRLKQLARQEGTTYHPPLIRRAAAK